LYFCWRRRRALTAPALQALASTVLGPLGLFASSKRQQPVTITWTREATSPAAAAYVPVAKVIAREAPRDRTEPGSPLPDPALVEAFREWNKTRRRVKAYEIDLASRKRASRTRGAACIDGARADYEAVCRSLKETTDAFRERQEAPGAARHIVNEVIPATPRGVTGRPSLSEELERLSVLHRDGSLSNHEFQAAKAHLIDLA
jgi:hypothetical protein